MRKFISLLVFPLLTVFIFLSFGGAVIVSAIGSPFLRVITDDTPFYKNSDDTSPLFYLPYTYYVKVLDDNGDFLHVECCGLNFAAIDGYVPKNVLFEDGLSVGEPYPYITIKTSANATLYQDSSLTTAIQYVFPEREMCYYGTYSGTNGNLYYVSYNGKLGYVKESEVYPFSIPNHPNELTFITPDTSEEEEPSEESTESETTTEDFFSLKIIIIVCLLFAGLVALFVALKGKPQKAATMGYYDENEYE